MPLLTIDFTTETMRPWPNVVPNVLKGSKPIAGRVGLTGGGIARGAALSSAQLAARAGGAAAGRAATVQEAAPLATVSNPAQASALHAGRHRTDVMPWPCPCMPASSATPQARVYL